MKFSVKLIVQTVTVASALLLSCVLSAAPAFQFPAYEKVQLENGLTIYLLEQHEVPLMTVHVTVKAGAILDHKAGLANLTAQSLMLGAGNQKKAQIAQTVDFLGASLNVTGDLEASVLQATFMAKDSNTMLNLVQATLLKPAFASADFAKLKQRQLQALENARQSPRDVIEPYFRRLNYGSHPYGNAVEGDINALKEISLDDVKAFYQANYQPAQTAIAVVGDFDAKQMKQQLNGLFAAWKNTSKVAPAKLAALPSAVNQAEVLLVNKSDAIETTFMIGGPGVAQDNPDYVGISVINTVLGGRFTSWLNDELRVNSGLTYGARSAFSRFGESGLFAISTFTAKENTQAALDLAVKTYQRLWQQGLDQATLDSAKAYVKGQFPPRFETNAALAGLLGDMYVYGFNEDYINSFQQKVDNLTLEESQRLIAKYFPQQNLKFVMIGQAQTIAPIAAKFGKVTQVDIQANGFAAK
jgi:DNA-directed RNA polymerase